MGHSRAATAIQVADAKKQEAPKPPPDAPKPPPPAPKHLAKRALAPAPERPAETPPAAPPLAALPDFGVELSGGVGGLAVAPVAAGPTLGSSPAAARSL